MFVETVRGNPRWRGMSRTENMTSPAVTAGNDSPEGPRRAPRGACAVILLAAGALRFAAGRGSLWLDEIWTLDDVRLRVASIVDIFTMGEENNHYLNTLVVWLLGPEQEGIAFRIP